MCYKQKAVVCKNANMKKTYTPKKKTCYINCYQKKNLRYLTALLRNNENQNRHQRNQNHDLYMRHYREYKNQVRLHNSNP